MSIDAGYGNPIDFLKYVLQCQDWGDNVTGSPSASARIRTGAGVDGSFDSTTLSVVAAINIQLLITDAINTKDLIDKICKQFCLLQYTDIDGYECVKYLFATTSDLSIPTFYIGYTQDIDSLQYPDTSKICVNPVINYGYDYATRAYTSALAINNVQYGTYSASYATGFTGGEGSTYWNRCRNELWPLVRRVEDMDAEWRDNDMIYDYAGAKFRLDCVLKLMQLKRISFTVPFELGYTIKPGRLIRVQFAHLTYTTPTAMDMTVTGVTKSKSSNTVTISGVLI